MHIRRERGEDETQGAELRANQRGRKQDAYTGEGVNPPQKGRHRPLWTQPQ